MEGCQGTAYSRTNLQVHFAYQNPRDSIVVMVEGNEPHPLCPQCDMFVPQEALNRVHPTSGMCRRGTERKRQRMVVKETTECTSRVLLA